MQGSKYLKKDCELGGMVMWQGMPQILEYRPGLVMQEIEKKGQLGPSMRCTPSEDDDYVHLL